MQALDLLIANGSVATAADVFAADVGIRDGRIACGRLSLPRLVAACSTNPARIFGLYLPKGAIAPAATPTW